MRSLMMFAAVRLFPLIQVLLRQESAPGYWSGVLPVQKAN